MTSISDEMDMRTDHQQHLRNSIQLSAKQGVYTSQVFKKTTTSECEKYCHAFLLEGIQYSEKAWIIKCCARIGLIFAAVRTIYEGNKAYMRINGIFRYNSRLKSKKQIRQEYVKSVCCLMWLESKLQKNNYVTNTHEDFGDVLVGAMYTCFYSWRLHPNYM